MSNRAFLRARASLWTRLLHSPQTTSTIRPTEFSPKGGRGGGVVHPFPTSTSTITITTIVIIVAIKRAMQSSAASIDFLHFALFPLVSIVHSQSLLFLLAYKRNRYKRSEE